MSLTGNDIYQFDQFELDRSGRRLSRNGAPISLYPKAFDVLTFLVSNPGRVVTKEEIFKAVWQESFVEEGNLTQQVSSLRKALGDRANCIVTIPGKGYQFVARVDEARSNDTPFRDAGGDIVIQRVRERTQVVVEESFPTLVHPGVISPEEKEKDAAENRRRVLIAGAIILATGVALFPVAITALHLWKRSPASSPSAKTDTVAPLQSHRRSVAVLGFRNLSGRPEETWLSTALAEMLSTELVAGEKLRLISGEDVARTKLDLPLADVDSLSRDTLAHLHRNLGSDLVVLGSYTALGEKPATHIRLDLRIQDTAAGETVADIAVMGTEADLFDMVSQAGLQLREKLGVEAVSPVEAVSVRASLPANREAARLYSDGLARLRVFDALGAQTLLEQAITADSKFAPAHSAIAESWSRLGYDKKAQLEARQAYDLSASLSREQKLLIEGRYRDIGHEYGKAVQAYRTLFILFPDNVEYGLKLATAQVHDGHAYDALDTVKSMRRLAAPASDDPRIDMQESAVGDALSDYGQQEQALARAAEKARAEGSRLVLAQARQGQCWVFGHTGPIENAVAACREAADIFAAAGDRQGEANSFRAWADALRETDASEAVSLYQRALRIFRTNGSERGAAGVYTNLGLIYEAQGDLAVAEKMQRQALAVFRKLDTKSFEAAALGNIADLRADQGDLTQAVELYQASLQLDPEDPGRAANAGYNIAHVHQLQGDLSAAKQGFDRSLTIWQKNGDHHSAAYAMADLGELMLINSDFAGAREMYERALTLRNSTGNQTAISETQLDLASLSLEEMRVPPEQEAVLRQALDVFQRQQVTDDEIRAWCLLSRTLLWEGKAAAANEAMQRAQTMAAKSQNPSVRWQVAIEDARVFEAQFLSSSSLSSKPGVVETAAGFAARKELAVVITRSHKSGFRLIELDARFALAEFEMKAGQTAQGRAHLTAIENDARAIGYILVARNAVIARG